MFRLQKVQVKAGKKTLLKSTSTILPRSEFIAVVGPNGAGKSTMLKSLTGLTSYSGSIYYHEKNIKDYKPENLAKIRGYMGQEIPAGFNYSVEEILMMGRYSYFQLNPSSEDVRVVEQIIEQLNLESLRKRSVNTLSGGEKQRVHFGRVIAQIDNNLFPDTEKVLMLDEPANNLDPKYQHELLGKAKSLTTDFGITVVCVMHDLNLVAQFADRVVMLKDGELMNNGQTKDVLTSEHLSELYEVSTNVIKHDDQLVIQFGGIQQKRKQLTIT